MPEKHLDHTYVRVGLQKVGGEGTCLSAAYRARHAVDRSSLQPLLAACFLSGKQARNVEPGSFYPLKAAATFLP